ncbi:MAG: PilC/PilY family type IV pilus protein [Acidobacteriota bacterium]|nr:PilC/PilY family type IV pilus protein [Acidobacteriota bacterium]
MFTSIKRAHWLLASLAIFALGLAYGAFADDRNLLRDNAADPYVFILLDTSGSMNWAIGDYLPTLRADDPTSKMYQAKDALYQVVESLEDIHFGFTTFNQDDFRVRRKHWAYRALNEGIVVLRDPVTNEPVLTVPERGDVHIFGRAQECYDENPWVYIGCDSNNPARMWDDWEKRRVELYAKFGTTASIGDTDSYYIRGRRDVNDNDYRFQVTFQLLSGDYGDNIMRVRVIVRNTNKSSFFSYKDIDFQIVPESDQGFITWDLGPARKEINNREGFFEDDARETFVNSTCDGWEGNDDTWQDDYESVSFRLPSPNNPGIMEYGDVIPLNWDDKNRLKILDRLAPNRVIPGTDPTDSSFEPDFRIAPYITDNRVNSKLSIIQDLRVGQSSSVTEDPIVPLIIPRGSTPLGNSLEDFTEWYEGPNGDDGWEAMATTEDESFQCRNVYVLMLTDGNETCGSDAPAAATYLREEYGVRTYVIGFGLEGSDGGDTLDDIALAGGTLAPFRPQSADELVETLQSIFNNIRPDVSTFASAAVPSVQTNVSDKIVLSTFTPVKQSSVWSGRMDAYLSPLPLDADGRPVRDRLCGSTRNTACRLWDGGEELMDQSLEEAELDASLLVAGDDPVGLAVDQRRLFYSPVIGSASAVPQARRYFWHDDADAVGLWEDLIFGLGIPSDPAPSAAYDAAKVRAQDVLVDTYRVKHDTIEIRQPDGSFITEPIDFVLGDIFHSDPIVVDRPNDFKLFSIDKETNGKPCDDNADPNPGYRCFFEKHLYRRKMLIAGSNDGQVHAFDAGIMREVNNAGDIEREFDNGTGREIFSFIPRVAMDDVRDLSEEIDESGHRFIVDGRLVPGDVFIDPLHSGTPSADEREWRTVTVAGMREGGRAIYAMDITQPDDLTNGIESGYDLNNIPEPLSGTDGSASDFVPSCINGGAECGTLPFPAMLWEFTDLSDEDPNGTPGDGFPDLGDTWSIPNIGLIKVDDGTNEVDRWVAVFGGGIDPEHVNTVERPGLVGNYLYMVDIETGDVLYKRAVDGAVPSAPAIVDRNSDLYLDYIYVGTTAGSMYKVDLTGTPPVLDAITGRIEPGVNDVWEPFAIFDTDGRPIFYPPAVVNVADRGVVALAFGTGDREDLWREDSNQTGRFYVVVDDFYTAASGGLPLDVDDLDELDFEDSGFDFTVNRLKNGNGWWVDLRESERQIANVFSLSGITIFSTYEPADPDTGTTTGGDNFCTETGDSRIYVVFTTTGAAVRPSGHYTTIGGFLTGIFTKLGQTQNDPDDDTPGSPGSDPDDPAAQTGDVLTDELREIRDSLKDLFPDLCRFGNFTINIYTQEQNTGQIFIAPVPICTVQHNWRDT